MAKRNSKQKIEKSGGKVEKNLDLPPKKLRFCEEYVVDYNGKMAAIRAGYAARGAHVQACRMLTEPNVKVKIDELRKARSIRTQITADRVLEELARLSFYDPKVIAEAKVTGPDDIATLPEDVRRAIIGWSWDKAGNFTLKLSDKKSTLEALGRHLALFTDNVEKKVELTILDKRPMEEMTDEQLAAVVSGS